MRNLKWFARPDKFKNRLIMVILGVLIQGFGLSWIIEVSFGTDPCSAFTQGVISHVPLSFGTAQLLINIILFVPGLNTAFGTRPIRVEHYMITLAFHVTHFYWGELVKWCIRHSKRPDGSPGFFHEYFFY